MQGWSDSDAFQEKGGRVLPACKITQVAKAALRLSLSQPPKPKGHFRQCYHPDFHVNHKHFELRALIPGSYCMPSCMKPFAYEHIPFSFWQPFHALLSKARKGASNIWASS